MCLNEKLPLEQFVRESVLGAWWEIVGLMGLSRWSRRVMMSGSRVTGSGSSRAAGRQQIVTRLITWNLWNLQDPNIINANFSLSEEFMYKKSLLSVFFYLSLEAVVLHPFYFNSLSYLSYHIWKFQDIQILFYHFELNIMFLGPHFNIWALNRANIKM